MFDAGYCYLSQLGDVGALTINMPRLISYTPSEHVHQFIILPCITVPSETIYITFFCAWCRILVIPPTHLFYPSIIHISSLRLIFVVIFGFSSSLRYQALIVVVVVIVIFDPCYEVKRYICISVVFDVGDFHDPYVVATPRALDNDCASPTHRFLLFLWVPHYPCSWYRTHEEFGIRVKTFSIHIWAPITTRLCLGVKAVSPCS